MKKLMFVFLFFLPLLTSAQKLSIYITDNRSNQFVLNKYFITDDSLVITGLADYGKSNVDYLRKKLTRQQVKTIKHFLSTFKFEDVQEMYFGSYDNLKYISADHFPRVIEVRIDTGSKKAITKISNSYVSMLIPFFEEINNLLPDEVKIRQNPEEVGKTF